jgi:hypothetical protein
MAIDSKWLIKIGDIEHLIEADFGAHIVDPESSDVLLHREGTLWVDGTVMKTWDTELPKEITFEIEGRNVTLRKEGLFHKGLALFLERTKIKPIKE